MSEPSTVSALAPISPTASGGNSAGRACHASGTLARNDSYGNGTSRGVSPQLVRNDSRKSVRLDSATEP